MTEKYLSDADIYSLQEAKGVEWRQRVIANAASDHTLRWLQEQCQEPKPCPCRIYDIQVCDSEHREKAMKLVIYTEPIPKARARTVVHNGKVRSYTPRTTAEAEMVIRSELLAWREKNDMVDCFAPGIPLHVDLRFVLNRPPSTPKKREWPVVRPDWDNYAKLVMDACNGYLWSDDSQVCSCLTTKEYGQPPRIEIEVLERR
jgi:Holliday junction resolvase RusA-like endonuclease